MKVLALITTALITLTAGSHALDIPKGVNKDSRSLNNYLQRFTPDQQRVVLQHIAAQNVRTGETNDHPLLIIAQAEAEMISAVATDPRVIEVRKELATATGQDAADIKQELQDLRDAAAAEGRKEGLKRLAEKRAADAQVEAMAAAFQSAIDQAMQDQRVYLEAMAARAKGQSYHVDQATARRIFGQ